MFRILVVCTGNVCRSPFAERVLARRLEADAPGEFEVGSAGLGAQVGEPMQPRSAELTAEHGGDPAGFVARQLTADVLTEAEPDLVITMTREQRTRVSALEPALLHRTFTVRELARAATRFDRGVLPSDPVRRWQAMHEAAARERGAYAPADPLQDDVVDPYRGGEGAYAQMVTELVPALWILLAFSRGEPVGELAPIEVPEPEPEDEPPPPRRRWWRRRG